MSILCLLCGLEAGRAAADYADVLYLLGLRVFQKDLWADRKDWAEEAYAYLAYVAQKRNLSLLRYFAEWRRRKGKWTFADSGGTWACTNYQPRRKHMPLQSERCVSVRKRSKTGSRDLGKL